MTTAELINQKQDPHSVAVRPHAEEDLRQEALLNEEETQGFRRRWQEIQGGFVDEPKTSVQKADELVATTIKRLAEIFAAERSKLESGWSKGGDVSTEDLRQALRRYRSFFDRMLTV
jgi:hypothetical protein